MYRLMKNEPYKMEQEGADAREWILQILRTRMAFRRAMQRALKKRNTGITFEMLQILNCLWQEQGISQQILAERTAKDKACLTNLMNNLEKKGFVRREEDCNDRRNKRVYLTELGMDFQKEINPVIYELYSYIETKTGKDKTKTCCMDLKMLYDVLENF